MKNIYISLDFLAEPIWKNFWTPSDEERLYTGIDKVDHDKELIDLNDKAESLYASYYSFDTGEQACEFSYEKERATKDEMLNFINQIKQRLERLNDGSFDIIDEESERIKTL